MNRRALLAAALAALLPHRADAATWRRGPTVYDLTPVAMEGMVAAAVADWSIPALRVRYRRGPYHDGCSGRRRPGITVCAETFAADDPAIGWCQRWTVRRRLHRATVAVDLRPENADARAAVVRHELGHALGLAHHPHAVPLQATYPETWPETTVTEADRARLRRLYRRTP